MFAVKTWPARPGRNPKTGESINISETHHPSFKTSRERCMPGSTSPRAAPCAPRSTSHSGEI
jgi:hypothetical protein